MHQDLTKFEHKIQGVILPLIGDENNLMRGLPTMLVILVNVLENDDKQLFFPTFSLLQEKNIIHFFEIIILST